MTPPLLHNVNVKSVEVLKTPEQCKKDFPLTNEISTRINQYRQDIRNILLKKDHRFLIIIGPCSIHDEKSALEYARKLKKLSEEMSDGLYLVMRVYFEKPRTTVGWKGFINDPDLDGSFKIEEGIQRARKLLVEISEIGLPLGTEALDPISPQYIQELISWSAIGARTTESQTHREMSSGLSTAIGFKNGTNGDIEVAINAMKSAANPHCFLGINQQGQVSVVTTKGNAFGHVVLRGGDGRPNYDSVNVSICENLLQKASLDANIMIDCSHANSSKDHGLQPLVLKNVAQQIHEGNKSIIGVMIESNLFDGAQKLENGKDKLKYGVSITDACIGWETTEKVLRDFHQSVSPYLKKRPR